MDGLSLLKSMQYKTLKASHTWSVRQVHWKTYQVKAYNNSYKQELREDNKQEADGESNDEENWMAYIDEANELMDELGGKVTKTRKKTIIWIQYDETLATKQKG